MTNFVRRLPCPFCAARTIHPLEVDSNAWAIICPACGAIGPVGRDIEETTQRWNERLTARAPGKTDA